MVEETQDGGNGIVIDALHDSPRVDRRAIRNISMFE